MDAPTPPLLVLLVPALAVAFDLYCLVRLSRARDVARLTKGQWAAVIVAFTPFGGISFLMLGIDS